MHGHVLRPFAADAPHEFAEARFCVLQRPFGQAASGRPTRRFSASPSTGFGRAPRGRLRGSGHPDQLSFLIWADKSQSAKIVSAYKSAQGQGKPMNPFAKKP